MAEAGSPPGLGGNPPANEMSEEASVTPLGDPGRGDPEGQLPGVPDNRMEEDSAMPPGEPGQLLPGDDHALSSDDRMEGDSGNPLGDQGQAAASVAAPSSSTCKENSSSKIQASQIIEHYSEKGSLLFLAMDKLPPNYFPGENDPMFFKLLANFTNLDEFKEQVLKQVRVANIHQGKEIAAKVKSVTFKGKYTKKYLRTWLLNLAHFCHAVVGVELEWVRGHVHPEYKKAAPPKRAARSQTVEATSSPFGCRDVRRHEDPSLQVWGEHLQHIKQEPRWFPSATVVGETSHDPGTTASPDVSVETQSGERSSQETPPVDNACQFTSLGEDVPEVSVGGHSSDDDSSSDDGEIEVIGEKPAPPNVGFIKQEPMDTGNPSEPVNVTDPVTVPSDNEMETEGPATPDKGVVEKGQGGEVEMETLANPDKGAAEKELEKVSDASQSAASGTTQQSTPKPPASTDSGQAEGQAPEVREGEIEDDCQGMTEYRNKKNLRKEQKKQAGQGNQKGQDPRQQGQTGYQRSPQPQRGGGRQGYHSSQRGQSRGRGRGQNRGQGRGQSRGRGRGRGGPYKPTYHRYQDPYYNSAPKQQAQAGRRDSYSSESDCSDKAAARGGAVASAAGSERQKANMGSWNQWNQGPPRQGGGQKYSEGKPPGYYDQKQNPRRNWKGNNPNFGGMEYGEGLEWKGKPTSLGIKSTIVRVSVTGYKTNLLLPKIMLHNQFQAMCSRETVLGRNRMGVLDQNNRCQHHHTRKQEQG